MYLEPGQQLGPYEIRSRIGEGGMGVVYRARDPRLERDVAIKVLSAAFAADLSRLRRFELEARAVGRLSHPNVLAVFDTGLTEGVPYLVMELLEGATLRDRMRLGPIALRQALPLALQVARGLAAAHEAGIVHRDLKPENLFVNRSGQVKILDFGLAKEKGPLEGRAGSDAETRPEAVATATVTGAVVGTLGYMSPEQVEGAGVDARSDLFSLGIVLWEMVAGVHPFTRRTAVETLHAVLREDPTEGPPLERHPDLERILRRCLAKEPGSRFQTAADLAFALEALDQGSASGSRASGFRGALAPLARRWRRAPRLPGVAAVAALGLALGALGLAWRMGRPRPLPAFSRLTFAQGLVECARFSADGRSVFICGRTQGQGPRTYLRSPEGLDPMPLDAQDLILADVSCANELAVLRGTPGQATLARMPVGGVGRDLQEQVAEAAWDASGERLAILDRDAGFRMRFQYPPGRVLHTSLGYLSQLRASRAGGRFALVDGNGSRGEVLVFEADGRKRLVMAVEDDAFGSTVTGLAWRPDGRELWATERQEGQTVLWALDLKGGRRMVWRTPGSVRLLDLAPGNRALMAVQQSRLGVHYQGRGETSPRDLSLLEGTQVLGFLPGGRSLLLRESPAWGGGTSRDEAWVREVSSTRGLRLARGNPVSISSDGRHVGIQPEGTQEGEGMVFTPTGAGQAIVVPLPGTFQGADDWRLLNGGRRVLFAGMEKTAKDWAFYVMERGSGAWRAITPVGVRAPKPLLVSPDEREMIGETATRGVYVRYPLGGGPPRPVRGLSPGERPVGWSADGRSLFVRSPMESAPLRLHRLDPERGTRAEVARYDPPDPAGLLRILDVAMAPDGASFAVTFSRRLGDLYLVEGLR